VENEGKVRERNR